MLDFKFLKIITFFFQFGLHWDVYIIKSDGTFIKTTVAEVLPIAFTPEHLAKI